MAETTGIAWTDATQNFWEGCTKVGPGCDHCYAENRDKRFHDGSHWGPGAPRRRMVDATFRRPLTWNRDRERYEGMLRGDRFVPPGTKIPPLWVFSLSLGDFFDNEVDPQWRADAWAIIRACQSLRWQIVTKRVGNVCKMLPPDWRDGEAYRHVGIIATTVSQEELLRDGPKLIGLKDEGVRWIGLSIEPQIEEVDLLDLPGASFLDWAITGGESQQGHGHRPRPYDIGWTRRLIRDCVKLHVPCFVKQFGDAPVYGGEPLDICAPAGSDPQEWPEDLRFRQMPRIYDRAN